MDDHGEAHELSESLAQILLAEKKAKALMPDDKIIDILYHIREAKYKMELVDQVLTKRISEGEKYAKAS